MKKFSRLVIASILVCSTILSLSGCSTKPASQPGSSPDANQQTQQTTLRIGTWNIAAKNHPDTQEMSKLFAQHNLDAVGFQEVDVLNGRNNIDMVEGFVTEDYPYVHFAKGRDFSDGYFGVGIVSKYQALQQSSIPIESTGSKATKALERYVFEKEGKKIAFYNTHLSWENIDLRRRQIAEVIEIINADPIEYKVVTADYNTDQHEFEYSMFLDNFNIANGNNGQWFDTYGQNDDPSMKVFTIDNVIATKNMRIKDVQKVENDLSDHYLLYAEFELLDQVEGTPNSNNLALGQGVTLSSTNTEVSPYLLVNYEKENSWISDTTDSQQITIELDQVYNVSSLNLNWGQEKASKITVSTSLDNVNFAPCATVDAKNSETETIQWTNQPAKFVKVELSSKATKDKGYEIKEIEVFGDQVTPQVDETNLLSNPGFETVGKDQQVEDWKLTVATTPEDKGTISFETSVNTADKSEGNNSLAITQKSEGSTATASLSQSIKLKPNTHYQLSFKHKAMGLNSASFGFELNQKNAAGESIPTHYAKLKDNLNMSKTWASYSYNFVTSFATETCDVSFLVGGMEGIINLDDVILKEVNPTQSIVLSIDKPTLTVNQTAQISAVTQPTNATDQTYSWVSSNPEIVSVDDQGKIMALKAGEAYVNYQSVSELPAVSSILITVK